jgi:hypothetical protein
MTVSIVATLNHVAGLATRVPDETLARRAHNSARTLRWALPLFAVAYAAMGLWQFGAGVTPAATPWVLLHGGISCTGVVIGIVLIVQVIRVANTMFAYRHASRRCRERLTPDPDPVDGGNGGPAADQGRKR